MSLSLGLLQGFQLELAYALVSKVSLDWLPQADDLLTQYCGERLRQVDHGDAQWINSGPRHSLHLASRAGMEDLPSARELFAGELEALKELADSLDARLLPSGMHPWMLPARAQAWPHGTASADEALSTLFGGERHGLCNQQPLRLLIPFASDFEFARLFGALRFVMPLLPALSASSPFAEGKRGPALSCRVAARRDLFASVDEFSDSLVPRPAESREQYHNEVVAPLKKSLEARSLSKTMQPLELCAHGIVADFEAGFVRVEMLDMQECLQADLAVCAGLCATLVFLQNEEHAALGELSHWPRARLGELLDKSLVLGGDAVFRDADFSQALGFPERGACRLSDLWQHLMEEALCGSALVKDSLPALTAIVEKGSLATRLLTALPPRYGDEELFNLYRTLLDCLDSDELL